MHIRHLLFSTDGRINRKQWWFGQLLSVLIAFTLSVVFHFSVPHTFNLFEIFSVHNLTIGAIMGIFYFWIHLALNVKRFHDINKHGGWVVLCYVPLIGFFVSLIVCGIIAGNKDSNGFGEAPK